MAKAKAVAVLVLLVAAVAMSEARKSPNGGGLTGEARGGGDNAGLRKRGDTLQEAKAKVEFLAKGYSIKPASVDMSREISGAANALYKIEPLKKDLPKRIYSKDFDKTFQEAKANVMRQIGH